MIALSAGHYPDKQGACYEGFCEYPEARRWVRLIEDALPDSIGSVIVPTGTLAQKVAYINQIKPTLVAEIHFNSDPTHSGKGSECLYHATSSKGLELANIIQSAISGFLPPNRGTKPRDDLYLLRKTSCPAVIIEPEFIHNRDIIEANRDVICEVIADALVEGYEEMRK